MRFQIQRSRIATLFIQRNSWMVVSLCMITLCFLLILLCFYLTTRERVVQLPPVVHQSFWVSQSAASPQYLSEMTYYFALLRLNISKENVENQHQLLLRYINPRFYGAFKNELIQERERIQEQHLSSVFYPVDIKVDEKNYRARIIGDLVESVGSQPLKPTRITYEVSYSYHHWRLLVDKFVEVKTHA